MQLLPIVFAAIAALVVMLGVSMLNQRLNARVDTESRMQTFVGMQPRAGAGRANAARATALSRRSVTDALNKRFARQPFSAEVRKNLAMAGQNITVAEFVLIRIGAIAAGLLAGFIVTLFVSVPVPGNMLIQAGGAVLGYFVPNFYFNFMRKRRLNKFEGQLNDAIDIMRGALEAGSSLPQSLAVISREMAAPISEEFGSAIRDIGLGVSIDTALQNMLDRVPSEDLDILVAAITIQHRVGGNLGPLLQRVGNTIRERIRIRGQVKVLTSQQSLSAMIVAAVPVILVILMSMIAWSYMKALFEMPSVPNCMLFVAAVLVCIGYYIMQRMAKVEF